VSKRWVWTCCGCEGVEICSETQPDEPCMLCKTNQWTQGVVVPEIVATIVTLHEEHVLGGRRFAPGSYEIRNVASAQDTTEPPF
jgi:hypothetical protein